MITIEFFIYISFLQAFALTSSVYLIVDEASRSLSDTWRNQVARFLVSIFIASYIVELAVGIIYLFMPGGMHLFTYN